MIEWNEMPSSQFVALTSREDILQIALERALGSTAPITHLTAVRDSPISVRVYATSPVPGLGELREPMSAEEMARDLKYVFIDSKQGRYMKGAIPKSIEVRTGKIGNVPVAIALATLEP